MHFSACLAGTQQSPAFTLHHTGCMLCAASFMKVNTWCSHPHHLQVLESVARQCKEAMLAEQDSFRGVISELDHAVTALQSSTDLAAVGSVHEQVSATACCKLHAQTLGIASLMCSGPPQCSHNCCQIHI